MTFPSETGARVQFVLRPRTTPWIPVTSYLRHQPGMGATKLERVLPSSAAAVQLLAGNPSLLIDDVFPKFEAQFSERARACVSVAIGTHLLDDVRVSKYKV